jgi:hypothetical protein
MGRASTIREKERGSRAARRRDGSDTAASTAKLTGAARLRHSAARQKH